MAKPSRLCEQVLAQTVSLKHVRARAMFGGHGLYFRDTMFALIANEVLYIKADAQSKDYFEKAGSRPFEYHPPGRAAIRMSYWEAPLGSLANADLFEPWVLLGIAAAQRNVKPKTAKKKAARKGAKKASDEANANRSTAMSGRGKAAKKAKKTPSSKTPRKQSRGGSK